MPTVRHPETGQEIEERRESPGRRQDDYVHAPSHLRHRSGFTPLAAVWALVGAIVVLYLFFVAFGNFKPSQAPAASIAVAVLAVLWFAHAYRRLWAGGFSHRTDRERRGF
jgi:membrane protein YdbS with pleckstrin-like domain